MSKKSKSSVLNMIERERHRVAANVTQESEWTQHEPNNGLGRMFIVMLLIHVFVIGGIILYDFVGDSSSSSKPSALQRSSATTATRPAATALAPSLPTPASSITTSSSHLVVSHDTLDSIAAQHSVDKAALITLNQLDKNGGTTIQPGVRLALPPPTAAAPATVPAKVPAAIPVTPTNVAALVPVANSISPPPAPTPAPEPKLLTVTRPLSTPAAITKNEAPAPARQAPPAATKTIAKQANEEPRRTIAPQPRPVPTPSATRRALENDERKAPVVKKQAEEPPSKKATPTKKPTEVASTKKSTSGTRITMAKGDTLYSLSRKHKVSLEALQKANNIKDPTRLAPGRALVIP